MEKNAANFLSDLDKEICREKSSRFALKINWFPKFNYSGTIFYQKTVLTSFSVAEVRELGERHGQVNCAKRKKGYVSIAN